MSNERQSHVELLIDAYVRTCYPNPFNGPDTSKADLVRSRIAQLPFSSYWTDIFRDCHFNYNGIPAGIFAQETLSAAEVHEGESLLAITAHELADSFADRVLMAAISDTEGSNVPSLVDLTKLSKLAQFLSKVRSVLDGLDGSITKIGAQPRAISDSWIGFAHALESKDPAAHDALFFAINQIYWRNVSNCNQTMEDEPYGYNVFSRKDDLKRSIMSERTLAFKPRVRADSSEKENTPAFRPEKFIATALASRFPDIVVSKLEQSPRYTSS